MLSGSERSTAAWVRLVPKAFDPDSLKQLTLGRLHNTMEPKVMRSEAENKAAKAHCTGHRQGEQAG